MQFHFDRVEDLQLKNRLFWWNFLWRYEYPWLKHKLSRRMLNSVLLYSGDFLFRFVIALFYLTDIYLTCSVCNPNERILLPNFNDYLSLNTGHLRTIISLNAKQNAMKLRSFNNDCLTSGFFGSYCTCIPYSRSIEEKGRRHCWMWGLVSLRTSAGLVLAKSYFYSLLDLLLLGCTMGAEVVRSRTNSDLVSIGRGQDFVLVKRHFSHSTVLKRCFC